MKIYFLGCDVSKGYADFIILDSDKNIIENNFQLDDTFNGHNKLYSLLVEFLKVHPNSSILSAVESTGGFENNWLNTLSKLGEVLNISVVRLNPLGVSHSQRALLSRAVTDEISAKNIAEYLINNQNKIQLAANSYYSSLRKQWGFVKLLVKQRGQLLNQLESIVYTANTEVLTYCKHSTPKWMLHVLKQYPTANRLARANVSSLVKIPYVSRDKAENLIAKAKLCQYLLQMIKLLRQSSKQLLNKYCCLPKPLPHMRNRWQTTAIFPK